MELTQEEKELVLQHRAEKKRQWEPPPVHAISTPKRLDAFDGLYDLACEIWNDGDAGNEDAPHWCYEAVMGLLDLGNEEHEPTIWDRIKEPRSGEPQPGDPAWKAYVEARKNETL